MLDLLKVCPLESSRAVKGAGQPEGPVVSSGSVPLDLLELQTSSLWISAAEMLHFSCLEVGCAFLSTKMFPDLELRCITYKTYN